MPLFGGINHFPKESFVLLLVILSSYFSIFYLYIMSNIMFNYTRMYKM